MMHNYQIELKIIFQENTKFVQYACTIHEWNAAPLNTHWLSIGIQPSQIGHSPKKGQIAYLRSKLDTWYSQCSSWSCIEWHGNCAVDNLKIRYAIISCLLTCSHMKPSVTVRGCVSFWNLAIWSPCINCCLQWYTAKSTLAKKYAL